MGEREVAAFAGGAIELAQGELYLFVPGRILDLRGSEAEGPVYEVCASNRDVEKRTLAPKVGPALPSGSTSN